MQKRRLVGFLVIVLMAGWLAQAWAQGATVNGLVIGKDGQVKRHVRVQFVKVDTPENYIAMTDEKGRYSIPEVRPGQYRVLITERKNMQNLMKRVGPGPNKIDLIVNW